ncbi:putative malonyl-CoA-acyl carrier protein transacylase, mitochondrial [Habropoda laboriosa]|uniref:Putative malonyl-CoA-acyl carrier protein transacylase, mitochondrial n=1 Tax=Habropoda laboriosa TaxID=597456 RepID=A0A0L7R3D3_9HYME|nr:PREDICTED: probable malonyl-CoA-acyl carrier protein transacylase, mitochondrial [Habropoda laboriosa]KOC65390.1 putative malonyl-CoA-acyl carrier protein transacylase, mitochondrial [Habropoda laboriosa]
MLQRILFKKVFRRSTKSYWLTQIKQMSNNAIKNENSNNEVSNIDESMRDSSHSSYNTEEVLYLLKEATTFKDVNNNDWMTTPYPKGVSLHQEEKNTEYTDPSNTSVLLFPGQGTIKVGSIKKYIHFTAAKELFEIANEIVNYDLLKLCLNGPQDKLNRTEFNQAATVISSLAALEKIKAETPKVFETCIAAAGYSVGEISALILSGAITFEDGIRLVWARGKAMQEAADKVPQGMVSITCLPKAQVAKACEEARKWAMDLGVENPVCRVAIYLYTERKILAGNLEALEYIEKHQTQFGLTNVTKLPVSGAFHTPLMEPALKSVFEVLNTIEINEPRCKVYSNYKVHPYTNLRFMKKYILKQIVSPVKWEQCLQMIYNRPDGTPFPQTYDIGSQGRMKSLLKLVNAKACRSCVVI